eukprot:427293-Prymnesium_polylepis.1
MNRAQMITTFSTKDVGWAPKRTIRRSRSIQGRQGAPQHQFLLTAYGVSYPWTEHAGRELLDPGIGI